MKNISNQTKRELKESGIPVVKPNFFNHHELVDATREAHHRIECVQAIHKAIQGIYSHIYHEDGAYLKADLGKKIPFKVAKNGQLYKNFHEHFSFHFKFLLDSAINYANELGDRLRLQGWYVDTLFGSSECVIVKVRVQYAGTDGIEYVDAQFKLNNDADFFEKYDNQVQPWPSELVAKIFPHKSALSVLRKTEEAESIRKNIVSLIDAHNEITDNLGLYWNGREIPRFR